MNTYINHKGNKIFISKNSWFVKGDRKYGPVKSDIYFSGQMFIDGELVNDDYEISQTKLAYLFRKVGA